MNKLEDSLRYDLQESLKRQGFIVNENDKLTISTNTKKEIRNIQIVAKNEIATQKKQFIIDNTKLALKYTINGKDINLKKIKLEIKPVLSKSSDEILFRWWNLTWWSMPYQRPYGRQMRFIIWDTTHNAPFGLISLQSPILKQAVRDKSLGIPNEKLDYWVNRSMFAQRTGALPPYNYLLGGKMVALSLISNEIKNAYQEKYLNKKTIIAERSIEPELLFITTSSAFGRSSIYNRLKYHDEIVAERLGYTEGFGSFQISDNLYERLIIYLNAIGENVKRGYGNGPSRKLKLIGLACRKLGLADYSYHGIKREYFLFSYVKNLKQVISEQENAIAKNYTFDELFDYWKGRWMENRAISTTQWYNFNMNTYITDVAESLIKEAS
jgi:uncharacterized protein YqgQ